MRHRRQRYFKANSTCFFKAKNSQTIYFRIYDGQQWSQKSSLAPIGGTAFSTGATVHNNKLYVVITDAAGSMSGDFTSKFFSGNRNSGERILDRGWILKTILHIIRHQTANSSNAGSGPRPSGSELAVSSKCSSR